MSIILTEKPLINLCHVNIMYVYYMYVCYVCILYIYASMLEIFVSFVKIKILIISKYNTQP